MSEPLTPLEYESCFGQRKNVYVRRRFFITAGVTCILFAIVIALMPSLTQRSRGYSPRAKCASNLHQIGLGILLYATENSGTYPDSMQTLSRVEYLTANVFVCPASSDEASTAPTTQEQIDDLANLGHCSYIYLGRGMTNRTVLPNQVIVYEPLAHHGDGMNVLLGDGHTEFVELTRAKKMMAAMGASTQPIVLAP